MVKRSDNDKSLEDSLASLFLQAPVVLVPLACIICIHARFQASCLLPLLGLH